MVLGLISVQSVNLNHYFRKRNKKRPAKEADPLLEKLKGYFLISVNPGTGIPFRTGRLFGAGQKFWGSQKKMKGSP